MFSNFCQIKWRDNKHRVSMCPPCTQGSYVLQCYLLHFNVHARFVYVTRGIYV